MYRLAIFIVVTSIVMGAAGVVYLMNAIKHAEDRRKHVAMTTACFFGSLTTALLATYMFSSKRGGRRVSAGQEVRVDPAVMLAASAGAGSTMT